MKKIFALLFLITITTVAFTTQANGAGGNQIELVSDFSPDYTASTSIDVPVIYQTNITGAVDIGKLEVVIYNVSNTINDFTGVFLPFEVGLTEKNSENYRINYAKTHLPFEVGLAKTNSETYTA